MGFPEKIITNKGEKSYFIWGVFGGKDRVAMGGRSKFEEKVQGRADLSEERGKQDGLRGRTLCHTEIVSS